jgi:3-oxoacyl-[acyl-carrier protein] reductase
VEEPRAAAFSGMLDGKRALVIGGGGGGIGRTVSGRLAAAGSAVAVADVDRGRAKEAAGEVEAAGVRGVALVSDVSVRGGAEALVHQVAEELGGLDVLMTVVGGQLAFVPAALVHETADDDWDLMFDLNLRYVAEAVRAALRVFLAQGTGGTIVSIGSIQAGTTLDWIPLGRAGAADEVADAAVFLASPLSSYISGQSLVVDGGATAAGPFPPSR